MPTPLTRVDDEAFRWQRTQRVGAKTDVDERFMKLSTAFGSCGGIARAGDAISLLEQRSGRGLVVLARWIVDGSVTSVEWQSDIWLPLFQFRAVDMAPLPGVAWVHAEFASLFDAWEIAEWFARPNSALSDHRPADWFHSDLPAVLNAARMDRFAALG